MSKFTVKVQPLGLLNGQPWPAVGETVDLPDEVGEGMVAAKHLEKTSAKKAAAKPDAAEKRPAPKVDAETRKTKS